MALEAKNVKVKSGGEISSQEGLKSVTKRNFAHQAKTWQSS